MSSRSIKVVVAFVVGAIVVAGWMLLHAGKKEAFTSCMAPATWEYPSSDRSVPHDLDQLTDQRTTVADRVTDRVHRYAVIRVHDRVRARAIVAHALKLGYTTAEVRVTAGDAIIGDGAMAPGLLNRVAFCERQQGSL